MRAVGWISAVYLAALLAGAAVLAVTSPVTHGTVDTTGRLELCEITHEPVITLDGDWQRALPASATQLGYVPVATVMSGWDFDAATGAIHAPNGDVRAHVGDRVRVKAIIVEVHGDPSPCYYTLGLGLADLRAE